MDSNWLASFGTIAGLVGGLELLDRTNFALIGYSAHHRPVRAWIGATLAFTTVSAIAVSLGAVLSAVLGPDRLGWLRIAGGTILIGYALYLAWSSPNESEEVPSDATRPLADLLGAFLLIFFLELGDTTMIVQLVLVPIYGALEVLVAAAVGLTLVAALACFIGNRLASRLPRRLLNRLVVGILLAVGAVTIVLGAAPEWLAYLG